jgi:choline dehydrogenase-like flavoprotein
MPVQPSDLHVQMLRAVCDTVVPSLEHDPDPHGLWRRSATDVGADQAILQALAALPDEDAAGLITLLDALAGQGFLSASRASREQLLRNLSLASRDAAAGVSALVGMTLLFTYAIVDPATGRNPVWDVLGYPGPLSPPPAAPKPIEPLAIEGDTTIEADIVVVGSGAGGGVIAGELAQRGLKVCVLEMGGYFNEADFDQTELTAYQQLYWRGGPQATADLNLTLQAGSCLGGGTVVNWTNSLRPKPWVREEWAREHGLTDVDTPDFDRHVDAVWRRLGVNADCCHLNRPHEAMKRGAEALGWSFAITNRNTDPERYSPETAGYMGFGDQSGAKNSTLRTYLQDAADHGADFVVGAYATRVLIEGGRAAGVEAVLPATGATVTVRASQVVVACGALESPGLLLRSGIGGPATGRYLRLHPCTATLGTYGEDMQAWWGTPHPAIVDEFAGANPEAPGYGFLLEGVQYTTGLAASALPFTTGEEHKRALEDFRFGATFIGLVRDHGHGQVTLDERGIATPWYAVTDPVDVATTHRALEAQVRLHAAAGAHRISVLAAGAPVWHRGEDDLDAYVERVKRIPLRAGAMRMFSAHQMGSCRMGADPQTSVADPTGQLHDVPGVWIGDASAFPTPSGTNPMITIMSLAHRTAEHVAAAAGATQTPALQEA